MNDPLVILNQNKVLCTGVGLSYAPPPNFAPVIQSEAEFTQLVSEYYVFFREQITKEVSFLRGVQGHRSIQEFSNSVYLLRTAKQHSDNKKATEFYADWRASHGSWAERASALASLLNRAVTELAHTSSRVRRDPKLTQAWKENASADPSAIFVAVCRDLSTTFPPRTADRLVRAVESRAKFPLRPNDNAREKIEAWCAEEITGQLRDLPVAYHAILDRLGLICDQRARAALHVAYSVAGSTSLHGEEFLDRVEEAWKVAAR